MVDIQVRKLPRCPRCNSLMVDEGPEPGELDCYNCGHAWSVDIPKPTKPKLIEVTIKPTRRIHGISAKESRRIWSKTPAGRRAQERYRRSPLFREAHARHRRTDKYRETQKRFREKRTFFMSLLYPELKTCPLKLFKVNRNGTTYNNMDLCDFQEGDCKFGCIKEDSNADLPESSIGTPI